MTNKELTDEILRLDPKAAVDGLNNVRLEALLASLKPADAPVAQSSVLDAEAKRIADAAAEGERQAAAQAKANAADAAARAGKTGFKVAPGAALTTLRGVISGDDAELFGGGLVSVADFQQGKVDLDRLVDSGHIVKL